ncbi:ATP-binding protein [Endozoicomonas sp. ALC020]|uniref:ATP-binding protein n=1 Tax=unclassified Endozoicomonas TaxID=2644528 RepID=UPI003BAE55DE
MDIKPEGSHPGTYFQPRAEDVKFIRTDCNESSTRKFSFNPSRCVSPVRFDSSDSQALTAIDIEREEKPIHKAVLSRRVSSLQSGDEKKSVSNNVSDDDTATLNDHLNSIRQITPTYKPFPKSHSTKSVAEQFAENTIDWLQLSNTSYADRDSVETSFQRRVEDSEAGEESFQDDFCIKKYRTQVEKKRLGVFYPEDYRTHELPGLSKSSYLGKHSLPEYFDITNKYNFVAMDNGYKPSECLNAFFHGPTIADCATTLSACQYRAIETIIGTDEFDRIFGAPISKFRIPVTLFGHMSQVIGCFTKGEYVNRIKYSNPLHCLFEYLEFYKGSGSNGQSELKIKKGDILYIQGVEGYDLKHATGDAVGFNLVCTGQNSSGQNLYLGFGPGEFVEPKTYEQVKKILIDGYNRPQSPETILAIKEGKSSYKDWTDDILPYDHPIGGITIVARFNTVTWENFLSECDQVWHRQPLLSVTRAMKPKPVHQVSRFHTENLDADIDQFEPRSTQQELMHETALKFTRAVINNQGGASYKKPMGLFLTGSPGLGKTHLCVAVTKKAADYGVNTLYLDADKAGELYQCFQGNEWDSKIEEMLAGKDLVVIDDANGGHFSKQLLAKTMKHVMTAKKAIMVSSNHHIPVKAEFLGDIEPLTRCAHNFLYLSGLQGDSCRSQWWQSPDVQAADALAQLGQYQGRNAAGVITEHAVPIEEMARVLSIPADRIRQVGPPELPGTEFVSQDFHFSHLSKTEHQAVFMECNFTVSSTWIEQFLNVVQKVHDEGLKLVVKTNDRTLFLEAVMDYLKFLQLLNGEVRIRERLEHMFPDFAESGLQEQPDRLKRP